MLDKKSSRRLRKRVQMMIVMCHLRETVTWIHRKRITDLTAFLLYMVRYFDPLVPNICLCLYVCVSLLSLQGYGSPQYLFHAHIIIIIIIITITIIIIIIFVMIFIFITNTCIALSGPVFLSHERMSLKIYFSIRHCSDTSLLLVFIYLVLSRT